MQDLVGQLRQIVKEFERNCLPSSFPEILVRDLQPTPSQCTPDIRGMIPHLTLDLPGRPATVKSASTRPVVQPAPTPDALEVPWLQPGTRSSLEILLRAPQGGILRGAQEAGPAQATVSGCPMPSSPWSLETLGLGVGVRGDLELFSTSILRCDLFDQRTLGILVAPSQRPATARAGRKWGSKSRCPSRLSPTPSALSVRASGKFRSVPRPQDLNFRLLVDLLDT